MNRFLQNSSANAARDLSKGFEPDQSYDNGEKITLALEHLRENHAHLAEPIFLEVLDSEPTNKNALFLFGCLKLSKNDVKGAINLLSQVTQEDANFEQGWIAYGQALLEGGRAEDAVEAFETAIKLNTKSAVAHRHLGIAYRHLNDFDLSAVHLRQSLGLEPDNDSTHVDLAETFLSLHQYDEAMSSCHSAILIDKSNVRAYDVLGCSLRSLGQVKNSVESFRSAIKLNPRYAPAYAHLAEAYLDMKQPAQALEASIQASQLKSDCHQAMYTRAAALRQLGRLDEAMKACERVLVNQPEMTGAIELVGQILLDFSLPDQALKEFKKVVEKDPTNRSTWSRILTTLKYTDGVEPASIRSAAEEWAKTLNIEEMEKSVPDQVQKIGFFCGVLGDNPVGNLILNLVKNLDSEKVDIYIYANQGHKDSVAEQIAEKCEAFRHVVGLDDLHVTAIVEGDQVDCLIDLTGHGPGQRLGVFAHRAAPLQLTWFGSNGTTGLQTMDGILADSVLVPDEEEAFYTEHPLKMNRPWLLFNPPAEEFEVQPGPVETNGAITFGSFVHSKRVSKSVVKVWSEIMRSVPQSRLIFKSSAFASSSVKKQFIYWFEQQGIENSRIDFVEDDSVEHKFTDYNQVDIALDAFPFTGATSVMEALWMGAPTISTDGLGYVGRRAKSVLNAVGLEEFIAETDLDYVELAVKLAQDKERLANLRKELRSRLLASPLCDGEGFAEEFLSAVNRLSDWKSLF